MVWIKRTIILGIMFLLMVGIVFAGSSFQEEPDTVTYSYTSENPEHPMTNGDDGYENTYVTYSGASGNYYYLIYNYTKIEGATNESMLKSIIADEVTGNPNTFYIPLEKCWDAYPNDVRTQIYVTSPFQGQIDLFVQCHDGDDWVTIAHNETGSFYEEGIFWVGENITDSNPEGVSISLCEEAEFGSSLPLGGIITLIFMIFVFYLIMDMVKKNK